MSDTDIVTSVIIPAYNCAATIAEAIDSVIAQQAEGVEIIVVDDGSTDSTPDVLRGFGNRITAVRQDNAGAAMARNKAVSLSHGKYLAFLDADDVWLPGRLARTVELLERKPGAVMAFGDYICVDHSRTRSERVSAGRAPTHQDLLRHSWSILPSAVTMRRTAFAAVGGFSEGFQGCGGEDSFM
ncbi:MAG TPA: glycosyltransferase family 2 protein, partial [Candidatus Binataceae bacterium]|nr:glycosyltransferase family 2 protein [Candidatus Binataceae bacterium]